MAARSAARTAKSGRPAFCTGMTRVALIFTSWPTDIPPWGRLIRSTTPRESTMGRRLKVLGICLLCRRPGRVRAGEEFESAEPRYRGPDRGCHDQCPAAHVAYPGRPNRTGSTSLGGRPERHDQWRPPAQLCVRSGRRRDVPDPSLYAARHYPGGERPAPRLTVHQSLTPATYYWRVHAADGANTGPYATSSFTVYVPVIIQPPVPVSPANGSSVSSAAPTLVVSDAARSGPAGPISYVFQVATDPNITNIVAIGQVAETSGQTGFALSGLASATSYYWRVRRRWTPPIPVRTRSRRRLSPRPARRRHPLAVRYRSTASGSDHSWTGNVENALRALLATGLAGGDGLERPGGRRPDECHGRHLCGARSFSPSMTGRAARRSTASSWFYVAYVPLNNGALGFQIVEFGTPPPGN